MHGHSSCPHDGAQPASGHFFLCWREVMKSIALVLCLLAALPVACMAAGADIGAQRLAANCAGCHGTDGTPVAGTFPALAGQPAASLVAAMKEFKAGTRPATVMHQIARGYSDAQIALLAAYFAARPSAARPSAARPNAARPK
jgi:cytochrome c553